MSCRPGANEDEATPSPDTAYSHRPEGGEPSRLPGPTTLPPTSSLFEHNPTPEIIQDQSSPYLTRQFQPPYNLPKKHPLYMSEMEPNAPVHHVYHPPSRPNSHYAQIPAELVPTMNRALVYPPQHHSPQPQRQFKKIVQRQHDPSKAGRRSSPMSISSLQNEEIKIRSPTMDPEVSQPFHRPLDIFVPEQRPSSYTGSHSAQTPLSHSHSSSSHSSQNHSSHGSSSSYSGQRQTPRSMPISGLLSDDPRFVCPLNQQSESNLLSPTMKPPQPTFTIRMRQQPLAARACGFGERDRRVIDPPPILQMDVSSPNATPEELKALLRQPYAVVHCTLWDPVNDRDDTAMPGTTDKRQQRRLMGTLVASPFVGNDEHNVEGCFFCFPDLSVRTPGTYSLKFQLVTLDPSRMGPGSSSPIRSTVKSAVFHVYNAKDFKGMRASTELTKRLKHQGCLISVKKGNARNEKNERDYDDEEDDDDEDDEPSQRKAAKRPKR